MSNILIISDNEVLNSLYTVNLKIYTGASVSTCTSLEDAIEYIENPDNKIDVVYSLCMIENEDTALLAYHHLIENGREVPIIVIGNQSEAPDEVSVVGNPYDIRGIVQQAASNLGITAKDMAEAETPDYYPMPIRMYFSLETAPCDTYYRVREKDGKLRYHKIFLANEGIWPKVKDYLDEGVSTLYVPAAMRFSFAKFVTGQLIDKLNNVIEDPKSKTGEKLDVVEQGIETVAEQIFEGEMTKEVIELSNKCMETMEEVIDDVPDLKKLLKELTANKSGFLYSHSIIAGFVATHILDNIEWGGDSHKEKLKFVLFFHDMYLTSVYKNHPELMYEDKLIFDGNLTEEEKEIVVSHAAEAAEAIKRYPKCPLGVDSIIRQHHGTSNGLGFATTYKDDISPLAKVLIISEAFTEEMYKTLQNGQKVEIPVIIEGLTEKFPKHTYVKISKTLETLKL
ncbi:HD domain-containing phosphohydrolase [Bacteriovorax sp. DB6_IX]|uniref:HD domain-containing phosphohydrolase n=1 Tax=Bacteriovorax sp. DB6_IX TaxID=1353530 RepID=UPI00038A34A4|nr:HD domain-containing phosphohydrolase [Bacteriovorax sp. DB6_IX]EQC52618.1 response regulator receiver domain protein [Bacteriovorax sp. DB6_IX]